MAIGGFWGSAGDVLNDSLRPAYTDIGILVKFMRGETDRAKPLYNSFYHAYRLKYSFKDLNALGIDAMAGYSGFFAARLRVSTSINNQGLTLGIAPEAGIDVALFSIYVGHMWQAANPAELRDGRSVSFSLYVSING